MADCRYMGYSTFLVAPWMILRLQAWRLYQKMAVVYTRSEVLVGSDRHKASKSERLLPPLYFVAAACIGSRMSYQMLGIIGNSKDKTVAPGPQSQRGGQLCRGCRVLVTAQRLTVPRL